MEDKFINSNEKRINVNEMSSVEKMKPKLTGNKNHTNDKQQFLINFNDHVKEENLKIHLNILANNLILLKQFEIIILCVLKINMISARGNDEEI